MTPDTDPYAKFYEKLAAFELSNQKDKISKEMLACPNLLTEVVLRLSNFIFFKKVV